MWEADKTVEVIVNYKGKNQPGVVGYCNKPVMEVVEGEWVPVDPPKTEILFGYCNRYGELTHMSYTLNHAVTDSWDKFATPQSERQTAFYFDAGGNGCPLYIEWDELRRALTKLGLLVPDDQK